MLTADWSLIEELGVLIGKGGLHGNVFRIKPPMCFTKDDAGTCYSSLPKNKLFNND